MIPAGFQYKRPSSLKEAVKMLQDHGDDANLLAGGHSLIPAMKLRLNEPGILIDISRLPELQGIKESGNEIVIGGGTTHYQIHASKLIQDKLPIWSEAADLIGDVQVRNRGTLGGSLAHADPAADWPAVLLATEATIDVVGPNGERNITAEDFFTGFYMTALEEGEIITAVRVPIPPANTKASYQKFMQPASRFAIVGCAAVVTRNNGTADRVRLAFTGVSDAAFRDKGVEGALSGKSFTADSIAEATSKAADGVDVLSDHFASEKYRSHLARVYARRALEAIGA